MTDPAVERRRTRSVWALIALVLVLPTGARAGDADPSREISNISVLGIDALEQPTHGESFEMLQYTPDPIQRFNRGSMKYVTKPFIDWVVRPLAKGWRFVFPTPARESLDNFQYNLNFLSRFLSSALQGEGREAVQETVHFLLNTTAGIAGLFDPASRWGIPTYRQDIGLAFANWGAGPGFYLMIPLLGPSSGRDGLGRIFDTALNPLTYVPGASLVFNINAFSSRIDGYDAIASTEEDLYLTVRALWSIQREIEVQRFQIPPEAYVASDPEPSLGVLLLKNYDPGFPSLGREASVEMPNTGRRLPYSYWLQEKPAPLAFVIPGIGAHRASRTPVALAEIGFESGYSVVTVTSPFHREFVLNALSEAYPGFTPSDAKDLYTALSQIHRQLSERYPGQIQSASLFGYSLGGIETLFVAAEDQQRPSGSLRFENFVAVNPPVELRYAAEQFDAYFDAPLRWPADQRDERVKQLAMKAFLVLGEGIEEGQTLPLDREESEFLIGLQGRTTLINTLQAIRDRGQASLEIELEGDARRGPLLSVVNQSSLGNYADRLAVPYFLAKEGNRLSRDELMRAASLRGVERVLRTDKRIRVITNADDFLVNREDLAWLQSVMGERLTLFSSGGHLGNLHLPEFQNAVGDAMRGLTPARSPSRADLAH